jgi:hypothetical protein
MPHVPFEPSIAGAQAPPPYACTGVKAFGIPLLADAAPLQALCNHFLSIAPPSAGISFEPIQVAPDTCSVTLEALDYTSLMPTTQPWSDLGGVSQHELLFAVPVVRSQNGVPVEVGIFIPYIFVDNLGSALAGREVLGLPKILARFTLDRNFPASRPIAMRFEGRKTVATPIQLDQIVKIAAHPSTSVLPSIRIPIDMFFGPFEILFSGSTALAMILAQAAGPTIGFSARMLVDPGTPITDAFQSILRSTYTTALIRDSGLLPPVDVTLAPLLDLDMQTTLGIRSGAGGKITSPNPFFLDFDFELGGLTTVWHS